MVTAFLLDTVTARATRAIENRRELALSNAAFERFLAELDKPAEDSDVLGYFSLAQWVAEARRPLLDICGRARLKPWLDRDGSPRTAKAMPGGTSNGSDA